jgi:hypothetical protein
MRRSGAADWQAAIGVLRRTFCARCMLGESAERQVFATYDSKARSNVCANAATLAVSWWN